MKGWEHITHMSEVEKHHASVWLRPIDPSKITSSPSGLIVGECSGKSGRSSLPMFPHPRNSSGGKLFAMAKMSIEIYLGSIRRTNLFPHSVDIWDKNAASREALRIHKSCTPYDRVILCGSRVGLAFGFSSYFEVGTVPHENGGSVQYSTIPHPKNDSMNPIVRSGVEMALHWAAGYNIVQKETNAD